MTEEKPAEAPAEELTEVKHFIEVRGQRIQIGHASAEQLAMMRITGNRLSRMDPKTASSDDVVRAYEKVVQVVTSLPVERDDRNWLEDLIISKEMDLDEASEVIGKASDAWAESGSREQRRATKATRKKVPAGKK